MASPKIGSAFCNADAVEGGAPPEDLIVRKCDSCGRIIRLDHNSDGKELKLIYLELHIVEILCQERLPYVCRKETSIAVLMFDGKLNWQIGESM